MADIFISYASEDRSKVEPLANALENQGWSVWWDPQIPPGKTFFGVIKEALEAAKCVVVLWSKQSINSEWVLEEANNGKLRGILVPAKIDSVDPPLGFGLIQAADLIDWRAETGHLGFESFLSAISDIVGPLPQPNKREEKGEIPESSIEKQIEVKPEDVETLQPTPRQAKPAKVKPPEPKPDAKATIETESPEPRKSGNVVKFGVVAGVIVLLMVGIWLYISKPTSPPKARTAKEDAAQVQKEVETRPGDVFRDKLKEGGEGPEMIILADGKFTMGSPGTESSRYTDEGPQRRVTISRPFALSIHEITFTEYDNFAKATGRKLPDDEGWGRGDRPVVYVSWEDATAYARWLSEQTGQQYRLPTEAEWEYAVRAGSTTAFSFGDDPSRLGEYAWFSSNSGKKTQPVGEKKPNDWGLYDMLGNVWEWVEDDWHDNYDGAPDDGRAWIDEPRGADRVIRGGGWANFVREYRSANRGFE